MDLWKGWLKPSRMVFWISIVVVLLLALCLHYGPWLWRAYRADRDSFTPFFTPIGALLVGLAAFGQWRTARLRHEEQTNADRQRRIIESFSKAVEQLGSDKLEVRLGGIYSSERISKESPDDYWTVMENVTAFVRERSQRTERERTAVSLEQRIAVRAYYMWDQAGKPFGANFTDEATESEKFGEPPAADIAAALTVIKRRSEQSREREVSPGWQIDLRNAVLRQADLAGAHLERADLAGAHLERADLVAAHLGWADLRAAHLERADLMWAYLERADLAGAHLEGASLMEAHLEKADLSTAMGLSETQLRSTYRDAETKLPSGSAWPTDWPDDGLRGFPGV